LAPDATHQPRRSLAAVLALVVAVSIVVLSPLEFARQFRAFARSFVSRAVGHGLGESRDPDYAAFLEGVRRLTPPDATIALVLPTDSEPYVSEATARLAPRRIVLRSHEDEATFVAAYRYQYRDVRNPDVMAIPNGALFRGPVISTK
jgi:hypothetical protein